MGLALCRMKIEPRASSDILSEDCWTQIFMNLTLKDQANCQLVCKLWKSLLPTAPANARLNVCNMPFAQHCATDNRILGRDHIKAEYVSTALCWILPKMGEKLQSISFWSFDKKPIIFTHICARLIADFCPNLKSLELDDFELCPILCKELGRLTKVQSLKLDNHKLRQIRDLEPFFNSFTILIHGMADLEHLQVNFADRLAKLRLPKLTALNVAHSNLDDSQLLEICSISTKLTKLNLNKCENLRKFEYIQNLKFLKCLYLNTTSIRNEVLKLVCFNCIFITKLSLSNCEELTVVSPIPRLIMLKNLNMSDSSITDQDLYDIGLNCKNLQILDLSNCENMKDFTPLGWLQQLEILNVENSDSFNDKHLINLAENGNLTKLVTNSSGISDHSIGVLAQHCVQLEHLSICKTSVTDLGVESLVKNCRFISEFILSQTSISDKSMGMCGKLNNLVKLSVVNCPKITRKGLQSLVATRQRHRHSQQLDLECSVEVFSNRREQRLLRKSHIRVKYEH